MIERGELPGWKVFDPLTFALPGEKVLARIPSSSKNENSPNNTLFFLGF